MYSLYRAGRMFPFIVVLKRHLSTHTFSTIHPIIAFIPLILNDYPVIICKIVFSKKCAKLERSSAVNAFGPLVLYPALLAAWLACRRAIKLSMFFAVYIKPV